MSSSTTNNPSIFIVGLGASVFGIIGGIISFFTLGYVLPHISLLKTEEIRQELLVQEESGVTDLVEMVNPAVVSIVIEKEIPTVSYRELFFDDLFGFLPPGFAPSEPSVPGSSSDSQNPSLQQVGGGSGFIITEDGLIVTNRHVVDDVSAVYTVVLSDERRFPAVVVARDPLMDVALMRIDATGLPTVELGDSDGLKIGQTVVAIGYALAEYGNTVTKGVVSGVGRTIEAGDGRGMVETLEGVIQTDAAINPGNSGGPLLDLSGRVIGINTAVSREGQLLGFAIPINSVRQTIETVEKEGRLVRPWLGVRYIPITPRLAEVNTLPVTYGVLVQRGDTREDLAVIPGSPADKAGIVENDIILAIDDKKLEDKDSLSKFIAEYRVGDSIILTVLRKGGEQKIEVKLEELPETFVK
jgi:serine protease Do